MCSAVCLIASAKDGSAGCRRCLRELPRSSQCSSQPAVPEGPAGVQLEAGRDVLLVLLPLIQEGVGLTHRPGVRQAAAQLLAASMRTAG